MNLPAKRLTTPEEMNLVRRLYPTGNHFVSLPVVSGEDASVDRVGVLHDATASLVEFGGVQAALGAETLPPVEPLLRPFVRLGGRKVHPRGGLEWRRLDHWLPVFRWRDPESGLELVGCLFAPARREAGGFPRLGPGPGPDPGRLVSHKGFVFVLGVGRAGGGTAGTGLPDDLCVGLDLVWAELIQTVYTSRRLPAELTVRRDRWTGGPVLEPRSGAGAGPAAMAIAFSVPVGEAAWEEVRGPDGSVRLELVQRPGPPGNSVPELLRPSVGGSRGASAAELLGVSRAAAFYFGLNREGDGARTVAVDLSRHGWEKLLGETCEALRGLRRRVRSAGGGEPHDAGDVRGAAPGAGAAAESRSTRLEERLNLNLLFNYFFAAGRTVDSEELVLVTSRSPLYYVSAAFWARDALLWSFPGLLLLDPGLAEEALGQAFGRYFRHPGIHSLYMDGGLLYPGFELDELVAYPLALWRYVRRTGDRGVMWRRELVPKLRKVLDILAAERHPDPAVELYRTFLLPSDDPATHPYVTYDNALTWRALLATADLFDWAGADTGGAGGDSRDAAGARDAAGLAAEAAALRARAAALRESIYRHAVVPGPHGPMFAWSFDLAGGFELGDEPPGSLELLTYYGFCSRDDDVWLNTVAWLHSRDNPYRYLGVPFPGLGCPHAEHPFVMSLFNALLGGLPARVGEAAEVLVEAPLDTGLACESFDRHTGEVKTGAAFATCAGFLGYAMDRVWGAGSSGEDRSGEDREDRNTPTFVE